VRTLIDPENALPHLPAPKANLLVCASIILDGGETTSGVSTFIYPLTAWVTNYLASGVSGCSLTRWTEDGHSSLVGFVKNLACSRMSYSNLPALHDLSSGSSLWAFSLRLHLLPTCTLWMPPIHLMAIVTSFIPHTSLCIRGGEPSCTMSHYLPRTLLTVSLQVSVTLCAVARFTCPHLHKVPGGHPSDALRTGPCRTGGRDAYSVIGCVPLMVVFGVGTQLPRRPVMMRRSTTGAGGGCYPDSSKFVRVKVG